MPSPHRHFALERAVTSSNVPLSPTAATSRRRYQCPAPLALLVALLALAFALSSCGGKVVTYTDADLRFSFQYNDSWTLKQVPASEAPDGAAKSLGVFDPQGSDAGDNLTFDYVSVTAYEGVDQAGVTLDTVTTDIGDYLEQLKSTQSTLQIVEQPTATTVNGLAALRVTYTYTDNDVDIRCSEYWLIGGGILFDLVTQSSVDSWEGNALVFRTILDHFTVGTPATGATTTAAAATTTSNLSRLSLSPIR